MVRNAHVALAVCYVRAGREEAVDRQVKEYVGPSNELHVEFWSRWVHSVAVQEQPSTAFGFGAQ